MMCVASLKCSEATDCLSQLRSWCEKWAPNWKMTFNPSERRFLVIFRVGRTNLRGRVRQLPAFLHAWGAKMEVRIRNLLEYTSFYDGFQFGASNRVRKGDLRDGANILYISTISISIRMGAIVHYYFEC